MNFLKFLSPYRKLSYTFCKQQFYYRNYNKKCVPKCDHKFSQNNQNRIIPLYGGILAYFGLGDKEKEDDPNDPEVMMGKVFFEIDNDNLNEAKSILDQIISVVDNQLKNKEITENQYYRKCGFIYSTYSNVVLLNREIEASVDKFHKAIRYCVYSGMSLDHEAVLELSLKLALVYEKLNKFDDADSGFTFIIDCAEKKLAMSDNDAVCIQNLKALLGMTSSYYGKFLYNRGRYEESLKYARKSLEIAKTLYNKNHTNVLSKMNDIGATYLMMKKYKEARTQFEEAINLYSKEPNNQTLLTVSVIYANLAQTFIGDTDMGEDDRLTNSERSCHKSEELLDTGFKMLGKEASLESKTHVTECFEMLAGLKSSLRVD